MEVSSNTVFWDDCEDDDEDVDTAADAGDFEDDKDEHDDDSESGWNEFIKLLSDEDWDWAFDIGEEYGDFLAGEDIVYEVDGDAEHDEDASEIIKRYIISNLN